MKKTTKKLIAAAIITLTLTAGLTACASQSDVASQNISQDAEYFKIERKIVFYNGITDKYIAEVTGKCSVDDSTDLDKTLAVTCKVGPNTFIKDYLGKSDNVTWFALQQKPVAESVYNFKITFKPETIIPNLQLSTSATDGQ